MGKRKSSASKQPARKKQPKLETVFDCPFCSHPQCVECVMDRKEMIGEIKCTMCAAAYSMKITSLSEPIDVFTDWLDECERANEQNSEGETLSCDREI